jgi:UDP-N-acetylglucosamine diphosphorylase/glucosamine-1-phosphate N-acetyltransferase
VALLLKSESLDAAPSIATPADYEKIIAEEHDKETIADFDTTATLYNYPWDVMADVEAAVTDDFARVKPSLLKKTGAAVHEHAALVNRDEIYLGAGVTVMPGAVIDATGGPVYVGDNTRVESHAAVYGPTYIGPNCVVVAGKISACSIGHTCRVGGEVEESIFHAYVNKYHAGFIGHSYVGPWVNFGAMTTNSDLKNNYSPIRCTVNGESVDSGSIKVGSFIGDHTKTGIGTLLNTGISIGVSCNLFGGTLLVDKEIPSFSWGQSGAFVPYKFEKAIETIERSMERRDCSLSDRERAQLRTVFDGVRKAEGALQL